MKKTAIITVTIFLMSFVTLRTEKLFHGETTISRENGMLNGQYISYYKNGKKKVEGMFRDNQRIGTWTVYDSLGQLRIVRKYQNSFQFTTVTVKNGKGEVVTPTEKVNYPMTRNKSGYYEYPKLIEKDIAISKRIWRTIEANASNAFLFDNNKLFQLLVKNIEETKTIIAYDVASDEFKKELDIAALKSKIAKQDFNVVGFKIKEDWFYNSSWQLSESRIIGLCPIIADKATGKQTTLFWVYYPQLRNVLASEKFAVKNNPLIATFDDAFQFRYFSSNIYKESTIYDKEIADYKTGNAIKEEAERIELGMIDSEHDCWIKLSQ
jgi:gliding motility associated protien GldN